MLRIPPSGYFYPNLFVRAYLEAISEVMGVGGLNPILSQAGLDRLVDNPPPANMDKEFDFADYSALNGALDQMYGQRGSRGLELRAGRAMFSRGVQSLGVLSGVRTAAFGDLPVSAKLRAGIPALARVLGQVTDQQSTVEDRGEYIALVVDRCPVCWGRTAQQPVCFAGRGLLEQGLEWLCGGLKFRVEEIECVAMGQPACTYAIHKDPLT